MNRKQILPKHAIILTATILLCVIRNDDDVYDGNSIVVKSRFLYSCNMVFLFAVLYAMVAFFAFVLMPFMYFYYEEKDEDVTTKQVKVNWTEKQ